LKVLFISLKEIAAKVIDCYAHRKSDKNVPKETLLEHTALCQKYFVNILEEKGLYKVFEQFIKLYIGSISSETEELFWRMLVNVVTFHDIGKINPEFQREKMREKYHLDIEADGNVGSKHSMISAIIYRDYFEREIAKIEIKEEKIMLEYFSILNSYIISRHHSDLCKLEEYFTSYLDRNIGVLTIEWLNKWIEKLYQHSFNDMGIIRRKRRRINEYIKSKSRKQQVYLYGYMRLLYSTLVAVDYYATAEYMTDMKMNNLGNIAKFDEIMNIYESTELHQLIRSYIPNENLNQIKDINRLRTEIFLEAENGLLENLDKNIFYLEAPTGSGKSNTAFNLSFQILKNNPTLKKIFYIYPFNTLVEQNLDILKHTFGQSEDVMKQIVVVNSLYPIEVVEQHEEKEFEMYQRALLDRQFLNYPIILSTHVSLFKTFFSSKRGDLLGFYQLVNSVIVLDEIQSYRIDIWNEMIQFLKGYAGLMNIKVIIMSATLPNLETLDSEKGNDSARLILDSSKYFCHELFQKRVIINYELLDEDDFTELKLISHILETMKTGKTILVEFIKKADAIQFYNNILGHNQEYEIHLITGDDNLIDRKNIVQRAREKTGQFMLVATQVIEAGVDIDMQVGYKDSSKLDSEEQFMGRINRSCKNRESGIVYFFNIADAKRIYRDDKIRLNKELTIENHEMRILLSKKDFSKFYDRFLEGMRNVGEQRESLRSVKKFFEEDVADLNFGRVEEHMRLIQDDGKWISVFLARDINTEDNEIISGKIVWEEYLKLLYDMEMDYAEKTVKLSRVTSKMNYFIYKIYGGGVVDFVYNDQIGDIYYIENSEKYFENGKFDSKKFNKETPDFI
jgi:CRISPR-associated helicase Cas3/CRISPR-associated endonuclease Cas3-HD